MPPEQNLTVGTTTLPQNDRYAGEIMAPRPIEENNIRTISIRQLNHGYVVEVGCQTLAIESSSKLIALFAEYVANPQATEQKYREGKLI